MIRTLIAIIILAAGALAFAQQPAPTIADVQGIVVESQVGKPAFPVKPFAFPNQAIAERARLLKGRSTVLALADNVPYASKSQVTVRYGATILESRLGSMSVGQTALIPYAETVVYGAEALVAPVRADGFAVQFADGASATPFALLVRRRSGAASAYLAGVAETEVGRIAQAGVLAMSLTDPLLTEKQAASLVFRPLDRNTSSESPTYILKEKFDPDDPVDGVFLILSTRQLKPVILNYAGFIRNELPSAYIEIRRPAEVNANPPVLEIATDHGTRLNVFPNGSGTYLFPRPKGALFSAVFRSENRVSYLPAGRWVSFNQAIDPTGVAPTDYINHGARLNDIAAWQRSVRRSRIQTVYTNYAPHTRAWWSGAANKMTRFHNDYFTNNVGFHDIDMVRQNRDQCLVGVYLGESLVEARQVRLFERSASILAEELSLAYGHCVLLHTVAPGKTIQSYEDILRLKKDIGPDFLLFEFSPSVFMYITPVFQRHFFGYAEGQSPVAAFTLAEGGTLRYLPPTSRWLEHKVDPKSTLPSGVYIGAAPLLAEQHAPPEVNAAWSVLSAMLRRYKTDFPGIQVIIEAQYERARCAAQEGCAPRTIQAGSKGEVVGGPSVFDERVREVCKSASVNCSVGRPGDEMSVFSKALIFENDFHYTRFGNDWLAHKMLPDLVGPVRAQARKIAQTQSVH